MALRVELDGLLVEADTPEELLRLLALLGEPTTAETEPVPPVPAVPPITEPPVQPVPPERICPTVSPQDALARRARGGRRGFRDLSRSIRQPHLYDPKK